MPFERWLISGRVQGVGYRAWMTQAARALEVAGWVRNRPDGRVEALVSAPEAQLARLREACHAGPPGAAVDHLAAEAASPAGMEVGTGFTQRPTSDS